MTLGKTRLFAHLETMRPYTLLWCGLVSLVGASLAYGDIPPLRVSLLAFFIPILGWIAGLYLADYCDSTLDAIQKPHRPIPSGRITRKEALSVGAAYAIAGLGLAFLLPLWSLLFVFIAGFLVFCYAKFTKTRGILGNLTRGALTVITYFFGVISTGVYSAVTLPIVLLSLVFFFHDTNSNIIGAIRDVHGDRTGGYHTTPVMYGIRIALYLSLCLSVLYLALTGGIVFVFPLINNISWFLFIFCIGIGILTTMYVALFTSLPVPTQKQSLRAHELFVAERIVFSSAFLLGIASQPLPSLSLFLLSLLLTLLSQHLLRERYELT
ncbi:MAG: UbiA family prenyltransferase [Candidatus Thermoplasmatota archaeon]|nr:UbiA family prenyltransferase [Candidatus Thermoplasmatota archaeon]